VAHQRARIGNMKPLISIIDDDQPVREALQRMLRSYGFATAVFESAERFLTSDDPDRTACLILDIRMPGMNGMALHRHLIAEGCRIPTILITACPTDGERERALATGVVSYLAKPFIEDVLLETVRQALELGNHAAE
jgi:FixJ family two-component response regulator